MRQTSAIAGLGLAVILGVSGCATTEYVEVRPQCTPPAQPALPVVDRGELWDALGDAQYRELERYINGVWAWADEQAALLGELCEE